MNLFFNRKNLISYTVDTAFDNNLSIYVQNGEVVVSAPWYLSKKQIQEAVSEKTNWILTKLNEYEERKNCNYNIILLGKEYPTTINFKHVKSPEVNLNELSIEIILPIQYKNKNINNIMKLITNKLYLSIANKEIDNIVEKVRLMLDVAPENFEIKNMKNALGSCINGKSIIINPELFKYNREIIEYIIIHEFCHLRYKNHTKSFYNLLKKYVPNYENLSVSLNKVQY